MAWQYGTLEILDTLKKYNNQNVLQFGEENLAGFIQQLIDAHNLLIGEMFNTFVGVVPNRVTTYGVSSTVGQMVDVDEMGLADAQKIPYVQDSVGFPLRRKQYALQWTRDYLENHTPLELATQMLSATDADILDMYASVRRALFTSTNKTGYIDRFVDMASYTLKALINADGSALPPHPITGATFNGSTHTHYLATASLTEADVLAAIETIREHGFVGNGRIIMAINRAQEAAVRAFAGFQAYGDVRLIYSVNITRASGMADIVTLEDRAIGIEGLAEVQIKPWVPANYMAFYMEGGVGEPPIGYRDRGTPSPNFIAVGGGPNPMSTGGNAGGAARGGLRLVADYERFPLHAQASERMYGMAIWNRLNAAVLYIGGGSYVVPVF